MENKEIVAHLEKSISTLMEKVDAEKASKADFAELTKQLNTMKATLAAMGEDAERETKKYNGSKVGWTKAMSRQWHSELAKAFDQCNFWKGSEKPEDFKKAFISKAANVNEYDSTAGAGMLQTLVDSVIHQLVPLTGVARKNCRVLPGIRGSINLNALNAYPTFGRTVNTVVRDDATVTPNSPTYSHVTVTPAQSSGIVKVTDKLIFDGVPGVLENAAESLAISAGLQEDTELFLGDGTATYNSFTGLKTATLGFNNQTVKVRTGSFSNFDPLLQCQQAIYPSIVRSGNTKYHMTPQTFAFLQTLKASTSGLYFFDLSTNEWKVAGTPIEFNQVMDSPDANLSTFAIGKVPVIYGDMNKAVTLGIGRDTIVKILDQLYAATNETGIRLTYDFGFGIQLPAALTRIEVVS